MRTIYPEYFRKSKYPPHNTFESTNKLLLKLLVRELTQTGASWLVDMPQIEAQATWLIVYPEKEIVSVTIFYDAEHNIEIHDSALEIRIRKEPNISYVFYGHPGVSNLYGVTSVDFKKTPILCSLITIACENEDRK